MKREINVFDYAGDIIKAMRPGILLTTKSGDKVNSMTIGWGTLGVEWGRPVFVAYVRDSRYTKKLLDKTMEFTVNVPVGAVDRNVLKVCGTKSGRDMDKITELGLTLEEPEVISVPGIRELPLTLECKVISCQRQVPEVLSEGVIQDCYAVGPGAGDYHTAYYGQILKAYIIE